MSQPQPRHEGPIKDLTSPVLIQAKRTYVVLKGHCFSCIAWFAFGFLLVEHLFIFFSLQKASTRFRHSRLPLERGPTTPRVLWHPWGSGVVSRLSTVNEAPPCTAVGSQLTSHAEVALHLWYPTGSNYRGVLYFTFLAAKHRPCRPTYF